VETPAAVVEPAAAAVEATTLAVEAPALTVEGKSEVEIPVERMELAAEGATEVAAPAAVEIQQHETQYPETPAAVVAVAVNTALLAQEPAPVDGNDEPMFASAASAVEQSAEDKAEEKTAGKPAEAIAQIEKSETTEASAPEEAVAAKGTESKPEESKAQELNVEELKAEKTGQPVAASAQEAAEAEEPAPSDAELAEALRLLTPSTGHADVSTVPSHGTLVAVGQLLAEEAARDAAGAPRWVAEPVTLSPEEAAISLEAEMFRTFAAMPAAIFAATSGGEIESVRITGVSAIAAAVENRLAEAELAASAKALAEQGDERCSETTAAETLAAETPAEVVAAASNAANPVVDGIEPEMAQEKIAPEKIEAEQKDFPARVVEEEPEEEVAAATFADAVGEDEVEATAKQSGEAVSGTTVAVATAASEEENQDSSPEVGSQESMGRDVKEKSGKSNWHQIHTAPAGAAASSDVETAKQAEHGAEEAPKAMAAAASAEGATASMSATDASTIASIVDSVLADLRPKIVEEIARKLAGK
jgi:hypothetical protein